MSSASIPGQLVQSLYLTLIHSLWQGLLLVAAVGLIMITTRNASARKRYNLLITALLLFVAGSAITFMKAWQNLQPATVLSITPGNIITEQPRTFAAFHPEKGSFVSGLIAYLDAHAGNIVLFWFLAICIRSLQLALGLQGLRKLRRTAVIKADTHWQQYVKDLSAKMGIRRFVSLAESGMAKVPLVIGHVKPLILIPVGLITALPPSELEAILIHELAHIRRRDYLVNLVQSLLEILFFFNPAIWWISSLIRAEREHCCDDIALAQTSSKKNYIQALVACEEYQLPVQAYAMALKGNKKHLVTRVKRIISNNNAPLNLMEKSMLAVCLVAAGIVMAAFTNKTQANTHTDTVKTEIPTAATADATGNMDEMAVPEPVVNDAVSTPEAAQPEIYDYPQAVPEPAEQPVLAEAAVPAEPVAQEAITSSGSSSAAIAQEAQDRKEAEVRKRLAEADRRRTEAQAIASARRQEARAEAGRRRDQAMADARSKQEEARRRLEEARHKQQEAIAQARYQQAEARRKVEDAQRKQEENIRRHQEAARRIHEEALRKHDEALRKQDEALRKQDEAIRKQDEAVRRQESTTGVILSELVKDGIVGKNDKSLDFKLTNDEFVVNKVKQPEPVFRKYRERYLKATGKSGSTWSVRYKRSND